MIKKQLNVLLPFVFAVAVLFLYVVLNWLVVYFSIIPYAGIIFVDLFIGCVCLCFYRFSNRRVVEAVSFSSIAGFLSLLFFSWSVVQVTASIFYSYFGDASYDTYAASLPVPFWLSCVLSLIVAPFAEELLFRGVLLDVIARKHPIVGLFVSSFVFAFFHGTLLHMYAGFIMGFLFGLIYLQTGRLFLSMVAHMFNNALTLFFITHLTPFVNLPTVVIFVFNIVLLIAMTVWTAIVVKTLQKRNMSDFL